MKKRRVTLAFLAFNAFPLPIKKKKKKSKERLILGNSHFNEATYRIFMTPSIYLPEWVKMTLNYLCVYLL